MANVMEILDGVGTGKRTGCPIEAGLLAVGNRTSLLVLREAFYGTRRFDVFAERLGVTDAAAASHLRALTEAGLLERVPYRERGQRTRYEYQLTDKGSDLLPALLAFGQWAQKHLWPDGPRVDVVERDSGLPVEVRVCAGDGASLQPDEITIRPRG